ncbi:hypothetical protein [Mesorhizobium sp. WSM4884]|uniref:hypothetical protein n=1 Tax=Mesorhizobium sp. WSM4884 TaxID=3038542 RepID=UPI0024172D62|nr:hypothetical protein [Mesorhizobium sp. WSM4884]MDG4885348.1 hypothetical protein [Mesorhizobium sp. WSM4884]
MYAMIEPVQFENGSLKAIPKDKLRKSDLSVCRGNYGHGEAARRNIVVPQIAKDPSKIDRGYVWATAREIRDIQLGNMKSGAICVVDDGLKNFRAHAVLGYAEAPDGMKEKDLANFRLAARGDLLKLFEKRGPPRDWSNWVFN